MTNIKGSMFVGLCALLIGCSVPTWATTYMVPMRDETKLATEVYLPEGDGPWPTILHRTPYGRSASVASFDPGTTSRFLDWGYAVVSQDWRGFGGSEGTMMPFEAEGWGEHQDGYDTVEWIAEQNWSNGMIGGYGVSMPGDAQNLLAGSYPPHLACQVSYVACSDEYSQRYFPGGVFKKYDEEHWNSLWGSEETLNTILSHPNYDPYWELLNADTRAAGMECPGFHIGGWYDPFLQGAINSFVERHHSGREGSEANQGLVIGPWTHNYPTTRQGALTYAPDSLWPPPSPDRWEDFKKFFDYWLKGIDDGFTDTPAVRYYVMGDLDDPSAPGNEWRSADDWPIPFVNCSLYLSPGVLTAQPESDSTQSYQYDPGDPVPTIGGANVYFSTGPVDQGSVEDRADVLVFSTEPLAHAVEVTGRIRVQLFVSSSCPDTDFMAKLTDVYPDGRSMLVADAAIRARHRDSMATEELMEPGGVYELWIDLGYTSIVFNKGHRIRVDITSSNYPRFDLNPNTGYPFGGQEETRIADNTIHSGTTYPSRIILPIAGPDSDGDGLYDIIDPLPYKVNPANIEEEMPKAIQDADLLISSLKDQALRTVLGEASNEAQTLLAQGDLVGSGHILTMITEALAYNIPSIVLPEGRSILDTALDHALTSMKQGRPYTMFQYITTGWKLGTLRQMCETLPGASPIIDLLRDAEKLMAEALPAEAARIADWCNTTSAQQLAEEIQLYEDSWQDIANAASERDLKTLEGLLNAAKDGFGETNDETCEAKLRQFRQKLDQIPEPALLPIVLILGLILLPALLRRRN